MKKLVFKGAGVALVTPYKDDGINYKELKRLIDYQINNHTDAIVIAGTTGESATMTVDEHKEIIKFAVETVNGRVPVIAGTGSNETHVAVEFTRYAKEVGADAALLVTPYYNKCTQNGLICHYQKIADAVDLPLILYDVPSRTGVSIAIDTYRTLAKHPNIVAVKEASGDLSKILHIRAACKDDLAVYSGNDDQIVPTLSLGAQGVISVWSNICPNEVHDLCQLYFDGKVEAAAKLQIEYADLVAALFCEVNPIPVKVAMRKLGWDVGRLRLPLTEMTDEHEALLEASILKHKILA